MEITIPHFTKAQMAFALYWDLLHTSRYEYDNEADPSWKVYNDKIKEELRQLVITMSINDKVALKKLLGSTHLFPFSLRTD